MAVHAAQLSLLELPESPHEEATQGPECPVRHKTTRRDKPAETDRRDTTAATPAPLAPSEPLLTTAEAARLLHVHPRTVQRLVRRGALSAVRLGRAVRFDARDVVALTDRLKRDLSAATPAACSDETIRTAESAGLNADGST